MHVNYKSVVMIKLIKKLTDAITLGGGGGGCGMVQHCDKSRVYNKSTKNSRVYEK